MKRLVTYLLLILSLSQCRKETEPAPEPLAVFSVQNNNCTAPCEIVFTNTSKDATSYRWDFADGQSSSEQSPKHTYSIAGSYIVKLTAKGAGGSNDVTQTVTIKAPPAAAVAQFSIAGGGCTAPCAVTLTNQSQNATSYLWDFGDGQTSTEQNLQHTYTLGKTYTIKLTATGAGGSSMLTKDVLIQIPPPAADFSFTGGDCTVPCEVAFTNKSTNADTYQWNFGDGGTSTEASPRHQYIKGGTFPVSLTATGSGKTATKTQSVTTKVYVVTKFWDRTYGSIDADFLYSSISTSDGGNLLGGTSLSPASDDKSESSRGFSDYWIVKMNSSGTKQWDKTFGGTSSENLTSIVATPDGGYLLAGYSSSNASGDKSENSKGGSDYWVVKINSSGVKQWDKSFGGNGTNRLNSVVTTPDGGYLLAGTSTAGISGDKSESSRGDFDYWVVKLSASGVKQWDKTFGGTNEDILRAIIGTLDGGYLLTGTSYSNASGDKSENSRGDIDYWVVKINSSGVKQWDKTFGGTGFDLLRSVTSASDGGYLLAGTSSSPVSNDKSENSKARDYWIVKISISGDKQWDKAFGGTLTDELFAIVATSDGGYLLAGYSDSNASGDKSESSKGGSDYWVVKINSSGVKQWDKTFGGTGNDFLQSAVATLDGALLLSGWSISNISGDKSENPKGIYDYWVIKIK